MKRSEFTMNDLKTINQSSNNRKKLGWVVLCLEIFLGLASITSAQEVAILKSADIGAYSEAITAFKKALPSTFLIPPDYDLQGDMTKGRSLARRIRASNAKIVLAVGLKASLVAKVEILDIPVIFCLVMDPEKYDLPTSNMVGLSLDIPFRQHLKPLHILFPKISRLGVLFDPQKTKGRYAQLLKEAKALDISIVSEPVHTEQDVPKALNAIKNRIDALWLLPDSTVLTENTLDFLISTTLEAHVPIVGFSAGLMQSGTVVGTYIHYADIGKQAAQLTQRLVDPASSSLFGTIRPPERVYQGINLKSARYLSLPLTPDVLRQFDEHS